MTLLYKRYLVTPKRIVWAINGDDRTIRLGCAWIEENKSTKKSQTPDKPTSRGNATDHVVSMKLGMWRDPNDIITHANFGPYRLDGFRSGGGQNWPFPIGLLYGPYNMPRATALVCDGNVLVVQEHLRPQASVISIVFQRFYRLQWEMLVW
jgi:hypothetical protein